MLNNIFKKIKPYIPHYLGFIVILIGLVVLFYYWRWYHTKVVVQPVYKTLTKVLPITHTKIKYKTLVVHKIQYIPTKEYMKITKTKKVPLELKNSKILAVGKVPSYGGSTQVVCILTKHIKGNLLFKQLPYTKKPKKFFNFKQHPFIGGGVGMYSNVKGTSKSRMMEIGDRFARIGNVKFKIEDRAYDVNNISISNFIGIIGVYRW